MIERAGGGWQCIGKVCFPNMGLARQVARDRAKGGPKRKGGKPGEAYRCDECGGIHIGRRKKKYFRRPK
jgi:hypothetical protein